MLKFVTLTLIGYLSYTIMDLIVQYLLSIYSLIQITWVNATVAFLIAFILFPILFGKKSIKVKKFKIHLARGILVIAMDLSAFYSYTDNSLSAAYSLILTAPLFASLLSIVFEKAKFTLVMWGLALTAFLGMMIVLNPNYGQVKLTLVFALVSALFEGITIIIYRQKGQGESIISFVLSGNLMVSFCLLPLMLINYQPMTLNHLLLNIGSGSLLALAAGVILHALRLKEVILVGTLQYSQIIWALLINYFFFHSLPQTNVIIGCILITIANILLIKTISSTKRMVNFPKS